MFQFDFGRVIKRGQGRDHGSTGLAMSKQPSSNTFLKLVSKTEFGVFYASSIKTDRNHVLADALIEAGMTHAHETGQGMEISTRSVVPDRDVVEILEDIVSDES